jgi:transcriptional regulator with XRE-family HTH domain
VPRSIGTHEYDRFRQTLIEARQTASLTQVQLAALLDRPQSFVSKYERGERRLDVIEFLEVAAALGVDPLAFIRDLIARGGGGPE